VEAVSAVSHQWAELESLASTERSQMRFPVAVESQELRAPQVLQHQATWSHPSSASHRRRSDLDTTQVQLCSSFPPVCIAHLSSVIVCIDAGQEPINVNASRIVSARFRTVLHV